MVTERGGRTSEQSERGNPTGRSHAGYPNTVGMFCVAWVDENQRRSAAESGSQVEDSEQRTKLALIRLRTTQTASSGMARAISDPLRHDKVLSDVSGFCHGGV